MNQKYKKILNKYKDRYYVYLKYREAMEPDIFDPMIYSWRDSNGKLLLRGEFEGTIGLKTLDCKYGAFVALDKITAKTLKQALTFLDNKISKNKDSYNLEHNDDMKITREFYEEYTK